MVATHIIKIKHSVLCVTAVYVRDVTNMIFVILHLNVQTICSSRYSHGQHDLLVQRRTRDWNVASLNPGRSSGEIVFSRIDFLCWLLFDVRSTPVLPQWYVKDPSNSAKSSDGRLHLNTLTPLTQRSRWADYAAVQA